MANGFDFSDGWLLTALWAGRDAIEIEKLRCLSDVFNHAVIDDGEVETGMRRLIAAGLAHPTDGIQFHITEKGRAFVNSHWKVEEGHIRNMFQVIRCLQASDLYVEPGD